MHEKTYTQRSAFVISALVTTVFLLPRSTPSSRSVFVSNPPKIALSNPPPVIPPAHHPSIHSPSLSISSIYVAQNHLPSIEEFLQADVYMRWQIKIYDPRSSGSPRAFFSSVPIFRTFSHGETYLFCIFIIVLSAFLVLTANHSLLTPLTRLSNMSYR